MAQPKPAGAAATAYLWSSDEIAATGLQYEFSRFHTLLREKPHLADALALHGGVHPAFSVPHPLVQKAVSQALLGDKKEGQQPNAAGAAAAAGGAAAPAQAIHVRFQNPWHSKPTNSVLAC